MAIINFTLMKITDKLPWRIQSSLGYRPKDSNTKPLQSILNSTQDNIPYNKYKLVSKGYEFHLEEPKTYLNDFRHPYFLINKSFPVEDVLFASLKGARYIQHSFVPTIIDSKNNIIDSAQRHPYFYNPFKDSYTHPTLSISKVPKEQELKGNTFSLATDGAHNGYFHVLTRLTAKLSVLKELNISIDFFDHFIVNGPETKYKSECLQLGGVPKEKIVFADENQHFKCDFLFFVPRIRFHDLGHEFLKDIFKFNGNPFDQKLYISRDDAKYRRLINEDALKAKLTPKNFQFKTLSGLSIDKQISLFNNSSTIIGIHGAGMANLIFCKEETNLIEIFDDEYVNVHFWFYAQLFKLHYTPVIGKSIYPESKSKSRNNDNDVILSNHLINKIEEYV